MISYVCVVELETDAILLVLDIGMKYCCNFCNYYFCGLLVSNMCLLFSNNIAACNRKEWLCLQ